MCLWPGEGNSGTLSVPMRKMDGSKGRHAAIHSSKTRKPLLLYGRESAIRPKGVVARHESSPGNDQVHNSDGGLDVDDERRQRLLQSPRPTIFNNTFPFPRPRISVHQLGQPPPAYSTSRKLFCYTLLFALCLYLNNLPKINRLRTVARRSQAAFPFWRSS